MYKFVYTYLLNYLLKPQRIWYLRIIIIIVFSSSSRYKREREKTKSRYLTQECNVGDPFLICTCAYYILIESNII